MSVPGSAQLEQILLSSSDLSKASLATRITVGRLRSEVAGDPSSLASKVAELTEFATQNDFAANDLANI
ncbi:hypothetical protein HJ526_05655 [Donghicola sp. C2-DW-16]|uniref:Uncharacterized protein n=1 Tax=Donghicola mangrovi TaxID=2729614 RepID=A0A850Q9L6_9RHOB|nr:hypothetical protein [Donghicola mangrovi]NVO23648.1 hypothetical protein [Donghicola mangrovi]NVO26895.1 hypothetical protein [Donghicola mangrovi]